MIVFPPDHPIGRQQRQHLREKLLPAGDREELVRLYGELVVPVLTELLDARVEELAARYEKSWGGFFDGLTREDQGVVLVTRQEAADMLGISLSSIQRLEERGELPTPQRFGKRTVRHRLEDVLAFAKSNGLKLHKPQKT